MIYTLDELNSAILGKNGLFQGESNSSLAFVCGIHEVLQVASQTNKDLENWDLLIAACCDDIYLIGSPRDTAVAYKYIQDEFKKLDLVTQDDKTVVYSKSQATLSHVDLNFFPNDVKTTEGVTVVGTPIGSDNFVHNALNVSLSQNDLFFRRLKLMDKQCALLLLRFCALPIPTWLSRTVHPSLLVEHASAFDGKILDAYSTVVGEIPLSEDNLTEINLPLHKAGSGLRKVEFTSPIAYFSSVVNSFHLVGQLIPNVAEDIKFFEDAVPVPAVEDAKSEVKLPSNFTSNVIHVASDIGIVDDSEVLSQDTQATVSIDMRSQASNSKELAAEAAEAAAAAAFQADLLEAEQEINPDEHFNARTASGLVNLVVDAFNHLKTTHSEYIGNSKVVPKFAAWILIHFYFKFQKPSRLAGYPVLRVRPKLQHDITREIEDNIFKNLVSKKIENGETAEVARILSHTHSGSSAALTAIPIQPKLVMDNHTVEVAERMRAGTFSFPKSLMCPCGKETLSLEHSLGCRKLRGVFIRHDCLVEILMALCRSVGLIVRREWLVAADTQKRMDFVIFNSSGGRRWFDVSVANPMAPSYATSQSAIKSREAYKIGKYSRLASENGASFVPLVFELFGSFSEAVSDFLKELAHLALSNAPDGSGFLSPIAFKNNWITEARKLLSISLARCNALIVEEAIIKSRGHQISSKHYASTRVHEHFHFVY